MADERMGVAVNLANRAHSQYMGMDFNSMCKFRDTYFGAGAGGIYTLFAASDDNGTSITAYFTLPVTDLGIPVNKNIRCGYVGGEVGGGMTLSVQFEDGSWQDFTLRPSLSSNYQQGQKFYGRYDQHGRYFSIKVANSSGSDFSVDQIDLEILNIRKRPSGA